MDTLANIYKMSNQHLDEKFEYKVLLQFINQGIADVFDVIIHLFTDFLPFNVSLYRTYIC